MIPAELTVARTKYWADEQTNVASKGKEAESSCLCSLGAVLTEHSPNGHNSSGEDASTTSCHNHLPQRLAHSKERRSNRDTK